MKLLLFSASIWLMNCSLVNAFTDLPVTMEITDEDRHLQNIYKKMDTALKSLVDKSIKVLISEFMSSGGTTNVSTSCLGDFLRIMSGVRKLQPWAINFLDASGKLNDGLLTGNIHMLGNYDQCLSSTSKTKNNFRGRYCLISSKPFLPDPQKTPTLEVRKRKTYENSRNSSEVLRFYILLSQKYARTSEGYYGICVPSGCNVTDVENIIKYVGERIFLDLTVQYCVKEGDETYLDARTISILCIFTLFGLLVIMGSAVERFSKKNNGEFKGGVSKILRCFSITTNFSRFISTKTPKETLTCLNGIRVLSVFYVIALHKFVTRVNILAAVNLVTSAMDYNSTFFFQIIVNATLTMEVFFFMSGFLNIYARSKSAEDGESCSWWKVMRHRMWRIIPSYVFCILLVYLFKPGGPLGTYYMQNFIDKCTIKWWRNLLFINNFFAEEKCFGHTWYIASDMQLYFLASFTIPILLKNPKKGMFLNAAVIVFGMMFTSLWVYLNKVPPAFLFGDNDDEIPIMHITYTGTFSHMASYFSGILVGYILSRKKKFEISKLFQAFAWMAASLLFTSMLFMTYRWNSGVKYTAVESMFYYAFSKPLYALSVGWMIFCCINGHGGIINYILSLKMWIPLSRLSFPMYLISYPIQMYYLSNTRRLIDSQLMLWVWEYFGDLCVFGLLSMVIVILVEQPIMALEKLAFPSRGTKTKTGNVDNVTINLHLSQEKNKSGITTIHGNEFCETNAKY